MTSHDYTNPDLSAVLKTLSTFATPTPTPPTVRNNANNLHHISPAEVEEEEEEEEYIPMDVTSPKDSTRNIHYHQQQHFHPSIARPSFPTTSSAATSNPAANGDSSTITTWPAALKHIMRAISQNEVLQTRIRRLIRSQREYEKQWWKGRETLLAKQQTRVEKKKQLDEVLRFVGAPIIVNKSSNNSSNNNGKLISTTEEEENVAEITNYDAKVYKASVDMSQAMESELRALGIPFFCIKPHLIVPKDVSGRSDPDTDPNLGQSQGQGLDLERTDSKNSVSREELSALRRRMLELLQDLCKD